MISCDPQGADKGIRNFWTKNWQKYVGRGSMLKFVIHWKHLLHFLFLNDANNSTSHLQWNRPRGNETDTKRRGQKECIKFNSIVSLEKDNLLASCHPPNVLCGIMIVTNQKNKACRIAFCNAHRYKYKIHVRCFCTFHIYMAHVWGVLGLSTCSRFRTTSPLTSTLGQNLVKMSAWKIQDRLDN